MIHSPLKWAGGKSWLVDRLVEMYLPHRHRRLVEPFLGSGVVSMNLIPDRALLCDACSPLIAFMTRLGSGLLCTRYETDRASYYAARDRINQIIREDTHEVASLFYYINRNGFNGLWRTNRAGKCNVPWGGGLQRGYDPDVRAYTMVTRPTWDIRSMHFDDTMSEARDGDFIFADPPYDGGFTSYSGEFGWVSQVHLAYRLSHHGGPVVATNASTPRILDLYSALGFAIEIVEAPRRIAGDRVPAKEMLATRNMEVQRAG